MKHLVEHVAQFVHDGILRAIGAVHTVIGALALVLLLIFPGVVEAWGCFVITARECSHATRAGRR